MKLKVLCYHTIYRPDLFERHVQYLVSGFNPITIRQLNDFFYANTPLPKNAVLLTFDDGDRTILTEALPILRKYKMPAVLFVITSLIGTQYPFWWDEVSFYTGDRLAVTKAKAMPEEQRISLLRRLRADNSHRPLHHPHLTWDELKVLESNNVSIANHSHTHPMFDKITDEQIKDELDVSSILLTENSFSFANVFAYPNGNFTRRSEAILSEQGFKLAFLFDHRVHRSSATPYRISRLSVNDTTPLWKLRFILSGWHSRILPLIKWIHRVLK